MRFRAVLVTLMIRAALPFGVAPLSLLQGQIFRPNGPNPSATGYIPNRTVRTDGAGRLATVTGTLTDCVRVDGSSVACGAGGGGGAVATSLSNGEIPVGAVNGTNAMFTVAQSTIISLSESVYRNGLRQRRGLDYTISGQTITFLAGAIPQTGDLLQVSYWYGQVAIGGGGGGGGENPLTFVAPLQRTLDSVFINPATTSANGYLTSTDWNTFNGKAAVAACPSNQVAIATLVGGISCVSLTTAYLPAAVVLTSGSYPDPAWITSLAWAKLTGVPSSFTPSTHTHAASDITSGLLSLARGGSGADLSASGGAGQIVKQLTAGGALSVGILSASEIPNLDASKITTGTLTRDTSGNAATATALAANGTNCSSGQAPLGVDAAGNAEGCFTPGGGGLPAAHYFGDGSDGNVTCSSSSTLTKDMFYNNLTVQSGCAITAHGFRIFVKGTLNITSAPAGWLLYNGSAGAASTGSAGGAAGAGSTLAMIAARLPGVAGATATTGAGAQGATNSGSQGNNGGTAGASGAGGTGSGGAGGAARSLASLAFRPIGSFQESPITLNAAGSGISFVTGGGGAPGGGSGAGDGTNTGGGGGGGGSAGGVGWLSAAVINRGGSTAANGIQLIGGVGGAGRTQAAGNVGGGGGGGGAGGGFMLLYYGSLTGSTAASLIEVDGGNGGNGGNGVGTGTAGAGGNGGGCGRVTLYDLTNNTSSTSGGGAGSAASGTTGGAGCLLSVGL